MSPETAPDPGSVRVGVAVPAAGAGLRMGGMRKPFLELAGKPLLALALGPILAEPRVVEVVVALGPDDAAEPPSWLAGLDPRVRVVVGGETRAESVRNALAAIGDVDVLAVHDAARPLLPPELFGRCIDVAAAGEGAVAGAPAVDTMKVVGADGRVLATADRNTLWHAHTPQVFPAAMLRSAYAGDLSGATDEASLVERHGGRMRMVDGGRWNLKVTRPEDVLVAEALLGRRARESP